MTSNLFPDLPARLPDELFTTLLDAVNVQIERIVSHGHASRQGSGTTRTSTNGSLCSRGAARLRFEDETVEMQPGDFVNISAHRRYRIGWTTPGEPTIWLTVYS